MLTCPNCDTQNIEGVRFCVQCGTALTPSPESWRGTDEIAGPYISPTAGQSSAGSDAPPYAASQSPMSSTPSFSPPLPAMSYGTHAATAYGAPMEYAEWLPRVGGSLIDGVATIIVYLIVMLPIGLLSAIFGSENGAGFQIFGSVLAFFAYVGFIVFNDIYLRSTRGATLGQGVLGLKTVTAENTTPPLGTNAIRFIVKFALGLVPCIGALIDNLWPLWDEKKQTLHDKAAGTFVVKA